MSHRARRGRRRLRPVLERLGDRCLPSGFSPAQIAGAYGLASIRFPTPGGGTVAGDGTGQTIAIVGAAHNPNLESDLRAFSREFGLPDARLTVVNLAGAETNPAWAVESALDVEWAHALAPGASIVVVEARSESAPDMLEAVDVARNTPGVVAVSMSWGFPETPGQRDYDAHFTTPAGHAGITFISASGDHGPEGGAVYPASSPNVVGVGGTTLVLDPSGVVAAETVWSKSGLGPSRYTPQPSHQRATQRAWGKNTPDVAFLGDPATGVRVYHTPPGATEGSWRVMAGTSLGAPAWAAVMAIVAQGRALNGRPSLDGPSQTLPMLYGLSPANFRTISTLGRGVPNGSTLIPSLVRGEVASPANAVPTPSSRAATPRAPETITPLIRRRAVVPLRPPTRRAGGVSPLSSPESRPRQGAHAPRSPALVRLNAKIEWGTPQRSVLATLRGRGYS